MIGKSLAAVIVCIVAANIVNIQSAPAMAPSLACPPVIPPDSIGCIPTSDLQLTALKNSARSKMESIKESMMNLDGNLTSSATDLTERDYGTLFNRLPDASNPHEIGWSGFILEECIVPVVFNTMLNESFMYKMNAPEGVHYADDFIETFKNLTDLVVDLKRLARRDPNVNSGSDCNTHGIPECITPNFTTVKSYTQQQERIRRNVNTVRTIKNYLEDLLGHSYLHQ